MEASHERVFYYHADAAPLGGFLTQPVNAIVPSLASSSLAQAGGHAASRICDFRLHELVSCTAAYSEVFGSVNKTNSAWTTLVTSVVEGLNVLDVVTADRVVSRISVEHPREGYHPRVSLLGSQFANLQIAGVKITPMIDHRLLTGDTEDNGADQQRASNKTYVSKGATQRERLAGAKDAPRWLKSRYGWLDSDQERAKRGFGLCSLVDGVQGGVPGSTFGHVIHVPQFGNIFLGELVVDQNAFQLTMIRIEMGCPAEGTVSVASSRSNGVGMP